MSRTPSRAWSAVKFAPSRCPNCESPFDSPESFAVWAGNRGESFAEARSLQMACYPELFEGPIPNGDGATAFTNPQRADFITCKECHNKTLRIWLDDRTVATREEAEQLVREDAFTCVWEIDLYGVSVDEGRASDRRRREQRGRLKDPHGPGVDERQHSRCSGDPQGAGTCPAELVHGDRALYGGAKET